jgi:hypothetical protein
MNKTLTIIAVQSLASAAILAQPNPDALKQRVLAQAQSLSPDDYAFTRTVHSETILGRKTEKNVIVEKFDPAKPADARWTLVSVDGAPPTTAQLNRYRRETAKRRVVPGYHRLANYFGTPATALAQANGETVFHFAKLPKGAVLILDKDFSGHSTVEVSVTDANGEPFAEQVRTTVKPRTRGKLLFRVNPFRTIARYRLGTEGKPLLAETTSEMTGRLMGITGVMRNIMIYSDYRPVR